ncbi:MAG: hypothetical protein P8J87_00550, partial [Verrucomicrobiales bacterium]|nr:hypothetical protein [Verrucomicrobiales bacterium]
VQDAVACAAADGAGVRVAGECASETRLANGGERIEVVAPGGVVVRDFSYDDKRPWPESADGDGASLVLVAPGSNPDHGEARSWRPSVVAGGNPGTSDAVAFVGEPLADVDGNGVADVIDYGMGDGDLEVVVGEDGFLTLGVPWRLGFDSVEIGVEGSSDLAAWSEEVLPLFYDGIEDLGGGRGLFLFRSRGAVAGGAPIFLRSVVKIR